MDVILLERVEKLGAIGDVVKVKDGFARNYLLPNKKALRANEANRKAHYVMLDLDAPAPAIAELERQSNINEDVIRFLTIRVDELEKGPSAMMRRGEKERERRSERGDRPDFRAREEELE